MVSLGSALISSNLSVHHPVSEAQTAWAHQYYSSGPPKCKWPPSMPCRNADITVVATLQALLKAFIQDSKLIVWFLAPSAAWFWWTCASMRLYLRLWRPLWGDCWLLLASLSTQRPSLICPAPIGWQGSWRLWLPLGPNLPWALAPADSGRTLGRTQHL
jgi:hypothetical protein